MSPHQVMHSVWWLLCVLYAWMCLWAALFAYGWPNGYAQAIATAAVVFYVGAAGVVTRRLALGPAYAK